MKTIWKYELQLDDFSIVMPMGSKIITVENGFLWAIVDPDNEDESREFAVHGTGHPITHQNSKEYVGTWFEGPFVWHLFEVK